MRGTSSHVKRERQDVNVWKTIRKRWGVFKDRTRFVVAYWKRIQDWKDVWCDDYPLKDFFTAFFSFAAYKDAWLVDVWEVMGAQAL